MQFYKNLSIRSKLIGLAVITMTLMAGGAWFNLEKMSDSYKESALYQLHDQADALGRTLAAQLFERYGDVQAFAVNDTLKSNNPQAIQTVLDTYISLYGIYDLILVVDKNGNYISSNSKDPSGKLVNHESLKKLNYTNEPWFKNVISGQTTDDKAKNYAGTYFEDFMEDALVKTAFGETRYGNSFSSAIKNEKGEVIGVITNRAGERWMQSDLKNLLDSLEENKKDVTKFQLYYLNKEGTVIQAMSGDPKFQRQVLQRNLIKENLNAAQMLVKGDDGFHVEPLGQEGKDYALGFAQIRDSKWIDSIGWTVLISEDLDEAFKSVNQARLGFLILLVICSLLAFTLFIWFSVVISKSLNEVTDSLHQNSDEVNKASQMIAAQAAQLSESSTEQAAALQETMSAVDEISAMVEKNAEAAERSKDVSAQSKSAAERGRHIVDQMQAAITEIDQTNTEISNQMEESNKELSEITKLITDIGTKTKVINEIVFQTKLLSFNASVEAARAGEYGKGFSVVAEEVGSLAQMSGNAAKEISTLLEESVRKVNQIVNESKSRVDRMIHVSKDKVEQGSKIARECNEALEEILTNVDSVDTLVSEISVASQEQSTGIKEISKAVGQMESVTQQNSSVAQASAASAEQLKGQASGLNEIVTTLVFEVNGKGADLGNQSSSFHSADVVPFKKSARPPREKISLSKKNKKEKSSLSNQNSHEHNREELREEPRTEVFKKASGGDFTPSSDDPGFGS